MVHADTHGRVVLLTDVEEGHELLLNLLEFCSILFVGIFEVFERTPWVHIVAGVDAHLLTIKGRHVSSMSREVDIGHERRRIAVSLQTGRDILHVLCLTNTLGSEAHQFTTSIDDSLGLGYTTLGIVGINGGHRLDTDGVTTANTDISHTGFG